MNIKVRITTPAEVIWEGEALSVSSQNSEGPFDILYLHTNFLSIIENKPIIIRTINESLSYTFPHSVIFARDNNVNIYANL